jgi:hypothetical protein
MMMFNGRSAKARGRCREGAANLDTGGTLVASDSRISKATRVIMLAFSLMPMIRVEVAVANPIVNQQMFQVEHVKIESTKKWKSRLHWTRVFPS